MRNSKLAAIIGVVLFLSTSVFATQDPQPSLTNQRNAELPAESPMTKEQAAKIVQELQMIRMLLERDVEAGRKHSDRLSEPENELKGATLISLSKHVLGSSTAPLTLVEFVDFECPFCSQFHSQIFPELKRKYIDTGILRFVVSDFPLPSHAYAFTAAKFARCAEFQGKYWEAVDAFMLSPQVATPKVIEKISDDIHLDRKQLMACLEIPAITDSINQDENMATSIGVVGTPTFLLGKSVPIGASGEIIEGASSVDKLDTKIKALLK
jgi:protein-disulfide isomerase